MHTLNEKVFLIIIKETYGSELMIVLKTFLWRDDGVTAIEYASIAFIIALSIIVGAGTIGTSLAKIFTNIASSLY